MLRVLSMRVSRLEGRICRCGSPEVAWRLPAARGCVQDIKKRTYARCNRMRLKISATLALSLLTAGCPGDGLGDPKHPTGPTDASQRDTELKHEECDLAQEQAVRLDANGDGRPEIIRVQQGGRDVCRAVDINMDGVIDVFIYYEPNGAQRRRESGFDRDTRPDEVSIFQGGVLVRKERETNNDTRIDTWDYYEGGRLVREERDSTGDGYVDQWWVFNRPGDPTCAIVSIDGNGDGQPDPGSELDLCRDKVPAAAKTPPPPPKPDGPIPPAEPGAPQPAPAPGAPAPGAPAPDSPAPDSPAPDSPAPDSPAPDAPAPDAPAPGAPAPGAPAPGAPAAPEDAP